MANASEKTRVFISSTHEDLVLYRNVVKEALLDAGFDVIEMDDFMARPAGGLQVSLDEVAKADVLIGIYAWRYGWIPPRSRLSVTEKEFREARKKAIPCLCFVADEKIKAQWNPQFIDTGEAEERLSKFKKSISKLTICRFDAPETLANQVLSSLHQWRNTQSQTEEEPKEKPAAEPSPQDPLHPHLLKLLKDVKDRATEALSQRTGSRSLDLDIKWRNRLRDPLSTEEGGNDLRSLPPGEIAKLFHSHKQLLVLGGPGAGKTVVLERLTLDLLQEIDRPTDSLLCIPVPVSLASWKTTDSDLTQWLIRELNRRVDIPDLGGRLMEGHRVLPLLDGLDEVANDDRPTCVEAIRRYAGEPGGPLVVSCRTAAHEMLPEPFYLQADVILQPMDEGSADRYLAEASPELDVLRTAVREHESLRELAHAPLWLKLMCDAFENASAETLQKLAVSSAEEQRNQVVKAYVEKMEERSGLERDKDKKKKESRRRLSWLARQMRAHRMKRFEIELLQPTWLPTLVERWLYAVLTRGLAGGLLAAAPAIVYKGLLPAGLAAGALAGTVDVLPLWRSPASPRVSVLVLQRAVRVLVIGAVSFMIFRSFSIRLSFSLLLGLVFGLVFGTRPGELQKHTRIFETLTWKWSWKGGLAGALAGILATAILAGLAHLFPKAAGDVKILYADFWLVLDVLSGLAGFVLGGLLGGLQGATAEIREAPNVGLRRGLRKTGKAVLWATALTVPAGLALEFLHRMGPIRGALSGLLVALFAGLWFGGLDLLQHWTTRALLSATGRIPWRWVRFLDRATDQGLLYRIKRGYEFPHDFVRDYFCDLSEPAEEAE